MKAVVTPIIFYDLTGEIIGWNKDAEKLFGYAATEILGSSFTRLTPENHLEKVRQIFQCLKQCQSTISIPTVRLDKNGESIAVQGTYSVIKNRAGEVVSFSETLESPTEPFAIAQSNDAWAHQHQPFIEKKRLEQIPSEVIQSATAITNSQPAETPLPHQDEWYRAIIEHSQDSVVVIAADNHINYVSPSAVRVEGYSAEELLGRNGLENTHPDDIPYVQQIIERLIANPGTPMPVLWRRRHKNGNWLWLEGTATNLLNNPAVRGIVTNYRDVTERLQAEENLRRERAQIEAVFQAIQEGLVVSDMTGNLFMINEAEARINGFASVDEMKQSLAFYAERYELRTPDGDLLPFENWPLNRVLRGEAIKDWELLGRRKDTGQQWVFSFSGEPVFDQQGEQILAVIGTRDITEQKRAEKALRESEALFSTVFRVSPVSIVITKLEDGTYLNVNDAFLKRYGLTREAVIGRTSTELSLWANPAHHTEMYERLRQQGYIHNFETRYRKLSGELGDILLSAEIIDLAGQAYVLSLGYDITERKQAEETVHQLNLELEARVKQRTAQLEAANQALESFSYSVSHDLRAPLRTIDGFSQAVLEDYGSLLPAEGQRYLHIICDGANHMRQLIDDLLQFSQVSRHTLIKQTVNSRELVQMALDELSAEKRQQLEIQLRDLPECTGDAQLLKQVWINLLSNALKYTRGCAPAIVEIGCVQEAGKDTFFVRDNGVGFDMAYAGKLFGVFQRLHRAEDFEGTGVGLSIARRIIDRHGGKIWAESIVDQGATFYFTLHEEP
ncbi:MAG: PAS domain S-box protein [Acidobacteriota bacterium]